MQRKCNPGFAGDGELRFQTAGADSPAARARGRGSFAQRAFPSRAARGRIEGLSATSERSGRPNPGIQGKRGAAPRASGIAGELRLPTGGLADPTGCHPHTAALVRVRRPRNCESGFRARGGASGRAASGDLAASPLRTRGSSSPELAGKGFRLSRKSEKLLRRGKKPYVTSETAGK